MHRAIHEDAQDFLQFKTKLLSDEAGNDPMKRAEMIRSVVTSIAAIPDAIQRSVYLQSSASQLKMDETVLSTEVAKVLHDQSKAAAKRAAQSSPYGKARGSVAPPPPAGGSGFPGDPGAYGDPGAAPLPDQAPPVGDDLTPALSERAVIENDLIRALLEHATEVVSVTMEGEEGEEPSTLEVPFAVLVIHRIEEEGIEIQDPMNQAVVKRFSDELDQERILTADQLAQDQDMGVQQKVAGALVQQHASPNGPSATRFIRWWKRPTHVSSRRQHADALDGPAEASREVSSNFSRKVDSVWRRNATSWPKESSSPVNSSHAEAFWHRHLP